ncbi:MAG: FAD-dependent monooxygenase [Hyphomicrobium sp.]|jgi:salicylate hydroxylase|nr:FAD-dependent monooxygenase [Hyphomicrobium sp.]
MTAASTSIAIAGAGIGGLTASLALARRGFTNTIYERRSAHSEAGAGIQLGPNATGVLARLGILESVRAVSAEPDGISVHDANSGRAITRLPLGAWMRARHGSPYLTLHRQDLHQALTMAVAGEPGVSILTGRDVVGFGQNAGGIDVRFANGDSVNAAALIAADGLWSVLRAAVTASAAPEPAGKCAYRAVVSREAMPETLALNDVHIWLSPGAHIVHYPVRQGAETAIVVVIDGSASHEGWDSAASRDTLMASPVATFAAPVRRLILAAQNWRMWPLQKLAPLTTWTNGAVALLGDAAHPLLPFFAQGGGLAIEDAMVLASSIADGAGPMAERLSAYEAARRSRAQRVVDASIANGRIYHLSGAARAARNTVLTATPAPLLMRRYDWLYGWVP